MMSACVLDFGVGTRTISNNLWAALVARDGHCRHPGCDRPANWCEGHHVVHFSQGGPTKLSNLVLACSRHHHIWHKGWKLALHDDALLELVSPTGELYQSRPPPLDFLLE
ncbi:MAG TPA: HNH endonuclease signature motif containing protein [Acidimicrobiales bacterium]|nr:HNH endonuclease signature motif containing protein [Acidimicrobiales bacterium]